MRVLVIGAGVHGASAALHLARAGAEVVVVDRLGAPAEGPTGRSSAICRAYYTNPLLARVARDSLEAFADFGGWLGHDLPSGYRRSGALFLHADDDLVAVERTRAMLDEVGTQTQFLSLADVVELAPQLALDGVGFGVWEPDAGQADPVATTTSMMTAARRAGATVRFGAEVAAIGPGSPASVTLATGEVLEADRVLVATGPWTRPLLATIGVDLPLTVERHLVTLHRWGALTPLPFVLADITTSTYLTLEGPGQFGLGPLDAGPTLDNPTTSPNVTQDEQVELVGRVMSRLPGVEECEIRGGWASVYDVSPDWQPVVGEVAEGVVVDAGTSGHGFKTAPAWGALVADLLLDQEVDPGLAAFSPHRFAKGALLSAGFGTNPIIG